MKILLQQSFTRVLFSKRPSISKALSSRELTWTETVLKAASAFLQALWEIPQPRSHQYPHQLA